MTINMNDSQLETLEQIKEFLKSSKMIVFEKLDKKESYEWVRLTLIRFGYCYALRKKEKGVVRSYIEKITGYSKAQVTRLVRQYAKTGEIAVKINPNKHRFERKYSREDIALLAETAKRHNNPNGVSLKKICEKAYDKFSDLRYRVLSKVSVAYIYVLMETTEYKRSNPSYEKTRPSVVNIGERRKPNPSGKPGYLRVDSVHQGDARDGEKGAYHINIVDEITQFEFIGSVPQITDRYLIPLLEALIELFPFVIHEIHSDNGSEYINRLVAKMLEGILVKQTKSRSRHCNDNALVEGKNNIVRRWIGYGFVGKDKATKVNTFYAKYFNEYLNYHRYRAFPELVEDTKKKGRFRKIYPYRNYMTPYEKLKSLETASQHLKAGVTFEELDKVEMKHTDNEMADLIQSELSKLHEEIYQPVVISRS